jgi:hypothetical protein
MPTGIYNRNKIYQDKVCPVCEKHFSKPKRYSEEQWNMRVCCSNKCQGFLKRGKELSEAHKENVSNALKGRKSPCGMLGRKHSEGARRKIRENATRGENHWAWNGGISNDDYPNDWNDVLKESIRMRDGYCCQECGTHQEELGRKLDVHHIDYDKQNLDPNNLIALCRQCHMKTNHDREHWKLYFYNE